MSTQEQLKTAQDYLAAADREFESGDALAGTQRIWDAITHTLTTIAAAQGWAHDPADLLPVVRKLAERDAQVSYILEGMYYASKGHPSLVRAEYFRFEDGDTHRARRMAREFIDTVLELAAESDNLTWFREDAMRTQQQMTTAQDYLDAADREFENANALAATEHLWAAMSHTLKTVAVKNGWPYDADDLYPVVEKIAQMDEQVGEVLLSSYGAAEGYPDLVRAGYLRVEDGDTHWARRVVHEFIDVVKEKAG